MSDFLAAIGSQSFSVGCLARAYRLLFLCILSKNATKNASA
jgi:hypothetical protein